MKQRNKRIQSARLAALFILVLGMALAWAPGCAETNSDPTTRALNDPMGYSPHFNDGDMNSGKNRY